MSVCATGRSDSHHREHVLVTGTREVPSEPQKRFTIGMLSWLYSMNRPFLHHGDCVGYDEFCHEVVTWNPAAPMAPIVHPPSYQRWRSFRSLSPLQVAAGGQILDPEEFLVRNDAMAERGSFFLAAPSGPRRPRSGTWYTVDKCREETIPGAMVMPDGAVSWFPGTHYTALDIISCADIPVSRIMSGSG